MTPPPKRILLLHPPYSDYTSPYHSLSYVVVAAAARASGYEADVFDVNVLWLRAVFTRERLKGWHQELTERLSQLSSRALLTIEEQVQVIELVTSLEICARCDPEGTVQAFQSQQFYEWDTYNRARTDIRNFERLLNVFYPPYDFYGSFTVPPHEPKCSELVAKARSSVRMIADFHDILESCCGDREYLFCGISVPYSANLLPALALSIAVTEVFPGLMKIAGGTAVSDLFKYRVAPDALRPFCQVLDAFYVGEAEPGLGQLADYCFGAADQLPSQVVPLADPGAGLQHMPFGLAGRQAGFGESTPLCLID